LNANFATPVSWLLRKARFRKADFEENISALRNLALLEKPTHGCRKASVQLIIFYENI